MKSKSNKPELSIVIITLNEGKNLPRLLKSVKKQDYKNYEIILSDAGSTDNTLKIAKKAKLKIVKGGLPARGRNAGARVAKGKFILFLDADVLLPNNFLKKMMGQMQEQEIDIATAHLSPLTKDITEKILHKGVNLWEKAMEKIDPHSPGACTIIKKSLFEDIGGFDESLKLAEDHALARKAFRQGAKYKILNVSILLSTRRLRHDGKKNIIIKYILAGIHRATLGEIRHNLFRYEMNYKH